jgi:hypothetical protein
LLYLLFTSVSCFFFFCLCFPLPLTIYLRHSTAFSTGRITELCWQTLVGFILVTTVFRTPYILKSRASLHRVPSCVNKESNVRRNSGYTLQLSGGKFEQQSTTYLGEFSSAARADATSVVRRCYPRNYPLEKSPGQLPWGSPYVSA